MSNAPNSSGTPPAEKPKDQFGEKYGILHFQYDVIARIIPGLAFCGLLIAGFFCLHREWACSIWQSLGKSDAWWLGVAILSSLVLLAYCLGQASDCLVSWWLTHWWAKRWWKRGSSSGRAKDWKWHEAIYCVSLSSPDHPEYRTAGKAQVESRFCANLGTLLVGFSLSALAINVSIASPGQALPWLFVFAPFSWALALYIGGYHRQGRRVWAILALLPSKKIKPIPKDITIRWEIASGILFLLTLALLGVIVMSPLDLAPAKSKNHQDVTPQGTVVNIRIDVSNQ